LEIKTKPIFMVGIKMSTKTSSPAFGFIVYPLRVEELKKILEQIRTEYVQIKYDFQTKEYTLEEVVLE
jgi:hypothetical protein